MSIALFAWDRAVIVRVIFRRTHYLRVNKCDFSFIPSFDKHILSAYIRHRVHTPHSIESKEKFTYTNNYCYVQEYGENGQI